MSSIEHFKKLHQVFKTSGYELRLVGGCVRDTISGITPADYDLATTATPDQMIQLLQHNPDYKIFLTGIQHGTITVAIREFSSKTVPVTAFEITTLRVDSECDGRHAEVQFTDDWSEDAARRDFTMNAMSMDVDGKIYDYFGGLSDIENRRLRFVGGVQKRIEEDALRIMRFFRFAIKFPNPQLQIYPTDLAIIKKNKALLVNISVERIWSEFKKMIKDSPESLSRAFILMSSAEVDKQIGLPLHEPFEFCDTMYETSPYYPTSVLAFHIDTVEAAYSFSTRWKLSSAESSELVFFVKHKNQVTRELIEDLFYCDRVDRLRLEALINLSGKKELSKMTYNMSYIDFPINGNDVMSIRGVSGIQVGAQLSRLKTLWKQSRYKLTRDQLLKELRND